MERGCLPAGAGEDASPLGLGAVGAPEHGEDATHGGKGTGREWLWGGGERENQESARLGIVGGRRDGDERAARVVLGCGNQGGVACRFIAGARGSGASRLRPRGRRPRTRGGCRFGGLGARRELIRSGCSAGRVSVGPARASAPGAGVGSPSDGKATPGRWGRATVPAGFTNGGRPCALRRGMRVGVCLG